MSAGAALRAAACVVLAAACVSCAAEGATRGPQILFAPAIASASGADQWTIVVQGRVWESDEGSRRRRVLIDVLGRAVGADRSDPLFRSRAGHLVSDSIGNASISIVLGGRQVRLLPSDAAGSFVTPVTLTSEQVAQLSHDGVISFESLPTPQLPGRFTGSARLVGAQGVTVVTDMDDTIKDTNVNDHAEARANTLMRPFRAVAGMPELYRAWQEAAGPGLHFHVVSAGPWQFHEPLRRFTEEAGFPAFTWDMRSVDTTDPATLLRETVDADPQRLYDFKLQAIRALMARLPQRHVVLVGDSGERDPETYATILSEFPQRVDAVFIRNVSGEGKDATRYQTLFPSEAAAAKLQVFADASELPRRLGQFNKPP